MPPPRGRLPLLALADYEPTRGLSRATAAAVRLALTDTQAALAGRLTTQTLGVLHCLVVSGKGSTAGHGGIVLTVGVVWLLTTTGWVGLRPEPDGSGRQLVDVVPVKREHIGGWLAPYLARTLEGASERS